MPRGVDHDAPYRAELGDQGPGAPYNARAKFYFVYSGDTAVDHDLRISHLAYDRTHTDIVEYCGVPRFLFSDFPLGNAAGRPHDLEFASLHPGAGIAGPGNRAGGAHHRAIAVALEPRPVLEARLFEPRAPRKKFSGDGTNSIARSRSPKTSARRPSDRRSFAGAGLLAMTHPMGTPGRRPSISL